MRVCMCECVRVCWMRGCVGVEADVCVCVCVCVCVSRSVFVYVWVLLQCCTALVLVWQSDAHPLCVCWSGVCLPSCVCVRVFLSTTAPRRSGIRTPCASVCVCVYVYMCVRACVHICVFVRVCACMNGEQVVARLRDSLGINLTLVDASDLFLSQVAGIG